jgi:hypothetical protein
MAGGSIELLQVCLQSRTREADADKILASALEECEPRVGRRDKDHYNQPIRSQNRPDHSVIKLAHVLVDGQIGTAVLHRSSPSQRSSDMGAIVLSSGAVRGPAVAGTPADLHASSFPSADAMQ